MYEKVVSLMDRLPDQQKVSMPAMMEFITEKCMQQIEQVEKNPQDLKAASDLADLLEIHHNLSKLAKIFEYRNV